ncbi:50S ribosomal protein L23 [Flammeovirga yaeyamensis]|uniref:Large ribosomal subunit protein uL23 n=3 Tax=Flammeovirga TaxID=59739 RepID=A0A1S1Z3C0_FLAPC|nr:MULTISPECIES: 50S ribosomal protein L23 [Flammeovirga]ANQ51051.1 50S ribosomal protein L23 [Flammeovirga sp. MY04]MBB3698077.1 large subunit ribosomal protein L23 [Flammeovirga yaeyamensis]NLR94547.1 50S ribosomal protein L23 [Flammeovirga agarivorans]NMF34564.1 50S ribosomal protein L23 [Flammeovirga yaeyamensis]OHX67778.1 50S ribosomal protein L23 [Flammeovirga pacifica]
MQVLVKPILTEKAALAHEGGVYTFVVAKGANKVQIKQAVEAKYGVNVEAVRTAILPGKSKTRYTKAAVINGHTSSFKKAMVKVAEGEIIDIYEGL